MNRPIDAQGGWGVNVTRVGENLAMGRWLCICCNDGLFTNGR